MRKLKLQMQISLDGFSSTGPEDDQQWVSRAWDEIKKDVLELAETCDTEIMGRKLAVDYIPFWTQALMQTGSEMHEVALIKAGQKKVVFSKTLVGSVWENTVIASGDLKEEVDRLKKEQGKDIIVYGGSSFVSGLIGEDLIDEYYFYVNPVALGKGVPVFDRLKDRRHLRLVRSVAYPGGITLLQLERKEHVPGR